MSDPRHWSDILPAKPRRAVVVAWALMAVLNLSAGLVIASRPERQSDLDNMRRWGHQWLIEGLNVYVPGGDRTATYPPHAIVALSPLGILPGRLALWGWTGLNLGLAVMAPCLAVRSASPTIPLSSAALPLLMFLCWGGFRAMLQFSLLTLTFGLLAMRWADKRPGWGGVGLALALMKPQIGVAFFLWAVFTRRFHLAGIATAVAGVGMGWFCLRAHVDPLTVARGYAEILKMNYAGKALVVGLSQMSPLIALATENTVVVDAVAGAIAVSLLAAIGVFGFREGQRREVLMFSAPPLVGIWSLLTFYHLTYGFLLLLPTATLLLFVDDPRTVTFRRRLFWALQLGLMFDVPGIWRRFGPMLGLPDSAGLVLMHADRVLMLTLFGCIAMLFARTRTLVAAYR